MVWGKRIYTLINRHKTAFSISLTILLIGVFSGIFHVVDGEISTELMTSVQPIKSFWSLLFSAVLGSLWVLLVLYISGAARITVYTVIPVTLLVKGYQIGRSLAESGDGVWGLAEKVLVTLPFSVILLITSVFGGMVAMSTGWGNVRCSDSYKKFFIILLAMSLVASLYYAIIKYVIGCI